MKKLTPEQLEIVMQPENVAERVELLKAMDVIVRSLNDESVMDLWLTNGVPDGADDSDYESIAEDVATPEDEDGDTSCFEECCRCFTACIAAGAKPIPMMSSSVIPKFSPIVIKCSNTSSAEDSSQRSSTNALSNIACFCSIVIFVPSFKSSKKLVQ